MELFIYIIAYMISSGLLVIGVFFGIKKLRQLGVLQSQQHDASTRRFHNEQHLQQMMQDPYLNPGLDNVVDRHYHGINNGMDPSHSGNDHNNGSGGFNNGF